MSILPDGALGEQVAQRLRDEQVVWLVTVGADGTPQPNPVWFLWDGGTNVLVYNRADAHRLAHIEARPHVSLHFDSDPGGDGIVVMAGTARRLDAPAPDENAGYAAKYAHGMVRVSGSAAAFAAAYPAAVTIDVRRVRGH